MLHEQLRNAWRARERAVPTSPAMHFASEGLMLGAGTVVVAAEGSRRLRSLQGQEARVLALLSAAYGKAVAPSVLGNIERAAKAWSEGDDCLAYIHLAHARLPTLQDPYDAARRLFIVDGFMKVGTSPRAVFEAFHFGAAYIDAVEKFFNPDEPRVPAGSGRTSGEWTDSEETGGDDATRAGTAGHEEQRSSLLGRMPLPAASFLGELNAAQAAELGAYVLRVLGPVGVAAAVFGLLFIPSPNKIRVEGEVPEIPGLKYSWNRDETELHLTYDSPDGARQTFTAQLQEDVFRDQRGQVVGRVLPGGHIAIDPAAVFPEAANDNNPKLCPEMGPDKPGERGRDYADYVKRVVNPPPDIPTPRYFGSQLPNPYDFGKLVYYDDCQHSTGTMVEAKGPGYAEMLEYEILKNSLTQEWLAESGRQVDSSHGRPIRWYFADIRAALFAQGIFVATGKGRENIAIVWLPWSGKKK
jgi:hypothetical protein